MYIRYALYVLIDLMMTILGLFVIPVGLLFCIRDQSTGKDVHMPKLFWPWDNEWDGVNYLETGTGFWQRWRWLAIRNHTRNFGAYVLGIHRVRLSSAEWVETTGDPDTTDNGHAGFKRMDAWINDKYWFLIYWIYQYPFWPTRCFRLHLGWKLDSGTGRAELVYTPNPFKKFSGPLTN